MPSQEQPASSQNSEHQRLLSALRESEILRELAGLLASSLDLDRVLQVLVQRTTEVCRVGRCAVWLHDEERQLLRPVVYHLARELVDAKRQRIADQLWYRSTIPTTNPLMSRLLSGREMLYIYDLRDERPLRALAELFLVRSILLVALVREDRPVGVMSLDNPGEHGSFSAEQQQLARAIGQQAAVAIDNARLYRRVERERQRAEQLIERSQAIYQVAMAVNSDEDLPTILEIAIQQLRQVLGADSGKILLLEEGRLYLPCSPEEANEAQQETQGRSHKGEAVGRREESVLGQPLQALSPLRGRLAASLDELPFCRQAATNGAPLFVSLDRLGISELHWFQTQNLEHTLITPLMVGVRSSLPADGRGHSGPRCVGLAFVSFSDPHFRPSKDHYTFAQDIAAQCALAVQKTQLLEQARRAASLATERANTLNAVFHAMTEGISVLDMEGRLLMANATAREFVGGRLEGTATLKELLRRHPAYTLQGQPLRSEDFPLARALRGEQVRGERFITRRADGRERILEINVAPLLAPTGQQLGVVSAFRDITSQMRIEQHIHQALETMLRMAEALSGLTEVTAILRSVLSMALQALDCQRGLVALYDPEQGQPGERLHLEREQPEAGPLAIPLEASERWTNGQAEAQQLDWLLTALLDHEDYFLQLSAGHAFLLTPGQFLHLRRFSRGHGHSSQGPGPGPGQPPALPPGASRWLTLVAPITHSGRLLGVMLLTRPSTLPLGESEGGDEESEPQYEFTIWEMAVIEGVAQLAGLAIEQARWQHEAIAARASEAAMREANALKDEFLALTAHEFRSPLTIILTNAQYARRTLNRGSGPRQRERLLEQLGMIEEQTRLLTNIVNTFLEATQINRGQLVIARERVDLEELAQQVVAQHRTATALHDLVCRVDESGRPYLVSGDRERLLQVLVNLIQNAIKYSPQGGPVLLSLCRCPQTDGNLIQVEVEDRGIGIPPEAKEHLFERFYRAPNTGTGQARGLGLGLYFVAEILRMHGGSIRVESSGVPGEGSRFILTLPALQN
ncbi:sensor histidine kinase [Thermogemmatispora onikobensis]|uniref:sensor histidine kinase n=1 Tax=Thermogemmatispora onikobensis TaxID=732234 RepID=UPI00159EFEED|nr:GAF domain-containing sensor histidine kinase [Thermogemmatispora onikobensis]